MSLSRTALAIAAAGFGGFGLACLVAPRFMLKQVDIAPTAAPGATELRAMYGGMELGLGVFFAAAIRNPAWTRPALAAQALGLGALAAARVAGVFSDRPRGPLMPALCVAEGTAAALAAIALATDR